MYLFPTAADDKITKGMHSIVKDAKAPYYSDRELSHSSISDWLDDKLLLTLIIKKGLSYDIFDTIMQSAPYSEEDWAVFLGISTKSMQRYKKDNKTFKSLQTEKIFEVTEVTILGFEIFGSASKFLLWLNTPNFALGSIAPMELLSDSYGKELVMTELTRLDHGIFI